MPENIDTKAEAKRLAHNAKQPIPIEPWGSYLSERQWGTVREDYSANGDAWNYITHEHSRSKAYRWGEDGLGGICDRGQNTCFALALWNGKDPILKERLFGLTNSEGNHGEDGKELYYFLDNTPSHSYMKFLYKYPQAAYPYDDLVKTNAARGKDQPEYELLDTGVMDDGRYFDITVEYAKNNPEDICIRITVQNHGEQAAPITILPTIWFRNTWRPSPEVEKPIITLTDNNAPGKGATLHHPHKGNHYLYFEEGFSTVLFTENETNTETLYNHPNDHPYKKDAFHKVIVEGESGLLADKQDGTKFAPLYQLEIPPRSAKTITLRLCNEAQIDQPLNDIKNTMELRKLEADAFYESLLPANASPDRKAIQRQAFAGLLWSKQFYYYDVEEWLTGDPGEPLPPPSQRWKGRNAAWKFLNNRDIISMPDTWEYPWYAAWDLAFHCIPLALVDPVFAKNQLILMTREWYMNPQGQIPAYEWNFSDVNPPVHAWAALSVYKIDKHRNGKADIGFLKRIFSKLTINFTWWVNRKDENGNNLFEGGFLGLDNIGIVNRSDLPQGYWIEQVDGTSWMAMYALNMMEIAVEIAKSDPDYEDIVTKFYEHYVLIAESLSEAHLWNESDGFFYDLLIDKQQNNRPMKVRSAVGLSVLFAVGNFNSSALNQLPDLMKRIQWFRQYREKKGKYLPEQSNMGGENHLISLIKKEKLVRILEKLLDENEFLSPGGIRALSKFHEHNPVIMQEGDRTFGIGYDPGESTTNMFGGNSNWRGPVWIPIHFLLVKALKKYYTFYGEEVKVAFPTGSGNMLNLKEVSQELANRFISIFETNSNGDRPVHADHAAFYRRPENKDLVLFYEYFHGDNSRGIGASHQTGWTAVVAELINEDSWEFE